jgi:hypothetical protein
MASILSKRWSSLLRSAIGRTDVTASHLTYNSLHVKCFCYVGAWQHYCRYPSRLNFSSSVYGFSPLDSNVRVPRLYKVSLMLGDCVAKEQE